MSGASSSWAQGVIGDMAERVDDQRTVVTFDDRADAEAEAARLVKAGIGATVDVHVPAPRPAPDPSAAVDDAPKENLWASLVAEPPGAPESGPASGPATGEDSDADGREGRSDAVRWDVRVLLVDLPRACEELGLPTPPPEEKAKRQIPPWAAVLIVWLVAMVTLPLLAFWITVEVLD